MLLNRTVGLCVVAISILALNLYSLGKFTNPGLVGFLYLGIRVVVFIGLAFLLVRNAGRSRFQAMSTVMLVGAIDQIALKMLFSRMAMYADPSVFGADGVPSDGTLLFGFATGFLFFAPILLIFGFLGVELNRIRGDWNRPAEDRTTTSPPV